MPPRNKQSEGAPTDNGGKTNEPVDPATAVGGIGSGDSGGSDSGGITDSAGTRFDPREHIHPDKRNADGSFRRKRGRKSGSGNRSKAQVYSDIEKSAEMLTRGLMIFHSSLAVMTKTPELMLEEEEAKGLSESGLTLLSLYDIRPDPKIEAAIIFASQVGLVYGTRIVAIKNRKAKEAKAERENKATVYGPTGEYQGETSFSFGPPPGNASETVN